MSDHAPEFSENERTALLRLARGTALQYFGAQQSNRLPPLSKNGRIGGVFITLWNDRELRGCVGAVGPVDNLAEQVCAVTTASLRDPRFCDDPVTDAEVRKITIEISVLSNPWRTQAPEELIPGVHGVIVRSGDQSGCFLPKVASERGWSAEEFLSHCCTMKAGLSAEAWREPPCGVWLFEVDSFCEPRPGGET